ncbi:MAG: hypothetical protein KTR32_12525 [Granulosicoccus sp.]|nr:hypothetical protein [Granulosicoccus sp.]
MSKPIVILDTHWRTISELFSDNTFEQLNRHFEIIWAQNEPIPETLLEQSLSDAMALVAATPLVDKSMLAKASKLRCVIEVSGAFPDTIDYQACEKHKIEVLSCSPGFRRAVAEMGLAMALCGARGLFTEHEAFRRGSENWLDDNPDTDFTLFNARIGFIGFGQIARELYRLLNPFQPQIKAYDPWLDSESVRGFDVQLGSMEEVLQHSQCLFVVAAPTRDNQGLLDARALSMLQRNAMVIVLSRAHLVDFDALVAEATSGRLRVATDVFPEEPLARDHVIRRAPNALLSPHRAAAVVTGRQLIGDMILHDLQEILKGGPSRHLLKADMATVADLAGVGDASQVAAMASERTE